MIKKISPFTKNAIIVALIAIISIILVKESSIIFNVMTRFISVLSPLFIGISIAYILNQPISALIKKFKIKYKHSVISVLLILLLVVILSSAYILPIVIKDIVSLANAMPSSVVKVKLFLSNSSFNIKPLADLLKTYSAEIAKFMSNVSTAMISNLSKVLISSGKIVVNIVMGFIFAVYMLLDKKNILKNWKKINMILFGKEVSDKISDLSEKANTLFSRYIVGLIAEAFLVGTIGFIGLYTIGVPYAIVLGIIMFFTNMIPYIGIFIGLIPIVLVTLMYNSANTIPVIIFILILQTIDGYFLNPKIMGNFIGLKPVTIFVVILIGAEFFGILGMLLSIPVSAFIKIILKELLDEYNHEHYNIK